VNEIDRELEREQVCKGLVRNDAKECNAVQAAAQLKAATEYMARWDPARQ